MDLIPSPGAWPLSAPATALLRDPKTAPLTLLRLALRELVVRGALRVEVVEKGSHPPDVRLAPGDGDATGLPAPLSLLAEALRPHVADEGTPAHHAVQRATGWRADLPARLRAATRLELQTAGLVVQERSRLLGVVPRTRWQPTPSGRAWARSASDVVVAGTLPAAGLLLALDEELQRHLRDTAVTSGGGEGAAWGDDDVDALDAVLGDAGPALDSAADAGSGGGGDGGDGGDGGGAD